MSVAEAQQRISAREFAEWVAFDLRDPIGPDRVEAMLAVLCATVANSTGRLKKPLKHTDFLPQRGPRKKQDPADMLNRLKLAARMGSEAKRVREERAQKVQAKTQGRVKS